MIDFSNIIIAVIAFAGTLVGSILSANKTQALIGYRLSELEKKVEKHNNVVERMYKAEKDISTAFLKIDEIRNDLNEVKHHEAS